MVEAVPKANEVSFQAHVELLRLFVAHHDEIVERIAEVLSAQRKPIEYRQSRDSLWRDFEACFFATPGVPSEGHALRGQLQHTHWASGFKPRRSAGMSNDLVDPAELMRRGFHLWTSTRWPGRHGRVRYARTLFNVYLVRQLALLAMRVWDAGPASASERIRFVQHALDELWSGNPSDQPVLVRDARSLIPLALSPATDELAPYFDVATRIATSFSIVDRVAILEAVVRMAGGHLRSYLHYYVTQKGAQLDEPGFVLGTRRSDALDFSLLIHGLVPLFERYEHAAQSGEHETRLQLADTICQGISADPELFINRVDLLGAYSMVEYLFTAEDSDGRVAYTPLGQRHVALLEEYEARIARVATLLSEDCERLRPTPGAYSPYGALYGYASNLLDHMALKMLDRDPDTRFSLEDVLTAGGADKREWVSGWRKLPHVSREVAQIYAYPEQFVEHIFARLEHSLAKRERGPAATAARSGRLHVIAAEEAPHDPNPTVIEELPARFVRSSDARLVAAQRAFAVDEAELLRDRQEGHFLVSFATSNGWTALTKDVLTEVLGAGRDARLTGLPRAAIERLRLLGRGLVEIVPLRDP